MQDNLRPSFRGESNFSPVSPVVNSPLRSSPGWLQDFLNRFQDDTFILVVDKMAADDPLFIYQE